MRLRRLRTGLATAGQLVRSLWSGPYWWLVPLLLVLLPIALFLISLQAVPIVAPFVYSIF